MLVLTYKVLALPAESSNSPAQIHFTPYAHTAVLSLQIFDKCMQALQAEYCCAIVG